MLEKHIQKQITDYLEVQEHLGKLTFLRNNSFAGSIQRRDGSRGFINNRKVGSSDIILLYKGKYLAIEVKNEKGKQSPAQKQYEELVHKCGGYYYIVKSIDELIRILDSIK